jgi:hypothetical protein
MSMTAVALLICVIAWSSSSQQSKLPKAWEYMVIDDPGPSREGVKYLNDLGAQGWELVAVSDNVIIREIRL